MILLIFALHLALSNCCSEAACSEYVFPGSCVKIILHYHVSLVAVFVLPYKLAGEEVFLRKGEVLRGIALDEIDVLFPAFP